MKILSIDGGGIRGIIPALVLAEIEERTGRRVADLFDLIAGTSTGGILAAALTRPADDGEGRAGGPRYAARDLIGLYEAEGPEIFDRTLLKRIHSVDGLLDERYDSKGLDSALDAYLGRVKLSEAVTDVLITAYEIEHRFAFFFRSSRARTDPSYDFTLADATRATAAAPTYFEPAKVTDVAGKRSYALIDGGVFAVNPSLCAFAEVARGGHSELDLIASLGTGSHTRALPYGEVKGWGQLEWSRSIIDVVFDGVADTTDFELAQLLPDGRYHRFQTELTHASDDLDDASPENIAALRREGEILVRERSADIDALCAALTA
jgi:patatin-like phospholipase/acyl hydrolase